MKNLNPLPLSYTTKLNELYREYIFVGGMPEAVKYFVDNGTFFESFNVQIRIYRDYEGGITKYVEGLDSAKVKRFYRHISTQLVKDNHKFQITKIGHSARTRDYEGCEDWLKDAGISNVANNLEEIKTPFSSYEMEDYFRVYYAEHSLFIANLGEESKEDLIINNNYELYNGALYKILVTEALVKSGFKRYFYKNQDATIELDFLIRVKNEILPIEVKRTRGRSKSLNTILANNNDITYGIKLTNGNISFENIKFTFPYYLTFLLKRFFKETEFIKWN